MTASPQPKSGSGLVDVDVAARFAARFASISSTGSIERSYLLDDLDSHLAILVDEAEPLVAAETGFKVDRPAASRMLTRHEWAEANIASMVDLLDPLLARVEQKMSASLAGGLLKVGYRPLLGFQMGTILGILSHRVLGQYDLLVSSEDEVWFVGTNLIVVEKRLGFVPRDFRLWVVLHELTHRAQFQGNPWLREHFLGLTRDLFEAVQLDPGKFFSRLRRLANTSEDESPLALLSPEQKENFDRLQAFMTVIEGHGNFVMDQIAARQILTHSRMKRVLQQRPGLSGPLGKILRRLLGLDLKMRQYQEGQKFFEALNASGGADAVRACFSSAEALPTLEEIQAPDEWLLRQAS